MADDTTQQTIAPDNSPNSKVTVLTEEQRRRRDEKNLKRRRLAAERREAAEKLARMVGTVKPSGSRKLSKSLYSICEALSSIPLSHKSDRSEARRRIVAIQSDLLDLMTQIEAPQQNRNVEDK